jgi:hypothetical protein
MSENRDDIFLRITKESTINALMAYLHQLNPSHPVLRYEAEDLLAFLVTQSSIAPTAQ